MQICVGIIFIFILAYLEIPPKYYPNFLFTFKLSEIDLRT